jgi:hypothetical protein
MIRQPAIVAENNFAEAKKFPGTLSFHTKSLDSFEIDDKQ